MPPSSDLAVNSSAGGTAEAGRLHAGKAGLIFGVAVLAVCWGFVFNALRVDWATNPQYGYGWFVPLLALGLFRLRWTTRPAVAPAQSGRGPAVLAAFALAALLPIRLIEEANPEWRLVQWTHAVMLVLVTFWCLLYAGGRPWVRHFAFPVCFLLVAVPWPVPMEQTFVQNLMQVVAGITVEAVGFLNIPAVQHGNIIQISSGLVGVDEACSGVRSLQTAFFICLFLGELHRFTPVRRLALLLLGLAVAVACNVGRTFFLVWSAARHGLERMHAEHDTAGQLVLVVTLICIWGLARWLKPSRSPAPALPAGKAAGRVLPVRLAFGALIWVLTVEAATEAWYRAHEPKTPENAHWSVVWPDAQSHAEVVPIDATVRATLRCNEGRAETWQDPAGNRWQAFFFRWGAGRNSAQLATGHTPDICLRGVGYELTRDLGLQPVAIGDLQLPFRQYVFSRGRAPLHVFYCRWEDRLTTHPDDLREDGTKSSRLNAVLAGRRHLGQRVLEIAISGPDNSYEALAALKSQIPKLIQR